ncbi:RagB/SusD family nutrient uptake outer membrane protein [Sinomicrobium sp.]
MKLYKLLIIAVLVLNIFTGCNDFLDEAPSKTSSVVPSTVEHLEYLLNNYTQFAQEGANELIYGTDDYGVLTELYDAASNLYPVYALQYATWERENLANYDRPYWPTEWGKIFTANLILSIVSDVSGNEDQKQELKAEAHFIRAYSYFKLANIYCLPYTEANKGELGLPIKETTNFEESVARASLEDTYNFIAADLEQALTLSRSLKEVNDKNRSWRASEVAVRAFAARYYLSLHDYERAQDYAEEALGIYSQLRNYNTDMHYSDIVSEVTIFNPDPTTVSLDYPYTHDSQIDPTDMMEWGESYYLRYLYHGSWYYIPSRELLDLYDQDYDLRYKYHIVEGYSYDRGATNPPYDYPGYVFFFKDKILSGPSVPEMILIKAECQIRQGSWQEGIETINELREVRMDASAPASAKYLSAASPEEALVKLTEERRREMPFTMRWYDVRRYNNNADPADDVVMTRTFYPYNANAILGGEAPIIYTLEKNSRKFACPIPNTDIIASQGVLKQNEY